LWLTISRTLRVLDNGTWIPVPWPADSNTPGPSYIVAVGDGSALYVWGSPARDENRAGNPPPLKAYIAKLDNGKPTLTQAPSSRYMNPFMDADGNLWIMKDERAPQGHDPERIIDVQRVGTSGKIDGFKLDTAPLLLDKSGNIWLSPIKDQFSLWKAGKIIGTV